MAKLPWKQKKDPLYRGDRRDALAKPVPTANRSIVRHILYLEGYGRETPYMSASESREAAERFACADGHVYVAHVDSWSTLGVSHRSRKELLQLLRGSGKGDAQWHSAFEVMRAHQYVEEWQEHLADFSSLDNGANLDRVVDTVFRRA